VGARRYHVATWCDASPDLESHDVKLLVEHRVWVVLERLAELRGITVDILLSDALNGVADVASELSTAAITAAIAAIRKWLHV
jgi:hypothetical protein